MIYCTLYIVLVVYDKIFRHVYITIIIIIIFIIIERIVAKKQIALLNIMVGACELGSTELNNHTQSMIIRI